tara:strand:+ start:42 stop:767 length:726 start_codon:yes stop_codon:yes gene_type:complete
MVILMKKLLGIIILGLLLSGNVYAGQSYQGKNGSLNEGISKIQFCKQEFPTILFGGGCRTKSKYFKNGIEVHEYGKRIAIFKNVKNPITAGMNTDLKDIQDWGDGTFHALVANWDEAERIIGKLGSTSNNSQSAGISFTIKDKKEQCAAIGFKPATDKFADCVLRLVELDLKKQINNPTVIAQDSGNQAIVNELKRSNNMKQSQFLMNLSNQLLNPSSPASSMSSSSCTVRGGAIKTINCW